MASSDVIAVVWAPHEGRTAAFAEWLDAELHNVHFLRTGRPWLAPLKYPLQWIATWRLLFNLRPRLVYVTNSPPIAGLCVMLYCRFSATRFIMDTHPPTLFGRKWGWTRPLQRFTARRALLNITDQEMFAQIFRGWNAPVLVLENPPHLASIPDSAEVDVAPASIAYVGTFGDDEPIAELLQAAALLPDTAVRILGAVGHAKREWVEGAPSNVTFTGYLRGHDYWYELLRSAAILVLTEHEHSLSGAAQDALRIGRPLVTSGKPTLRAYFTGGTVFVANTADGIAEGIKRALAHREALAAEMADLQKTKVEHWQRNFETLRQVVRSGKISPPLSPVEV